MSAIDDQLLNSEKHSADLNDVSWRQLISILSSFVVNGVWRSSDNLPKSAGPLETVVNFVGVHSNQLKYAIAASHVGQIGGV